MVSLNQLDKVREMTAQGWEPVQRTNSGLRLGGPVLMRQGDRYVFVHASHEVIEATPQQVKEW